MLNQYDEMAKGMFQPDTILPEQLCNSSPLRKHPLAGLARAILLQAWEELVKYNLMTQRRASRLYREAWEYIFDDSLDAMGWPLSFVNACAAAELDPAYIRRGIRQRIATLEPGKPVHEHPSRKARPSTYWRTRVRCDKLRGDELLLRYEGQTISLGRFLNTKELNARRDWARSHPAQAAHEARQAKEVSYVAEAA